MLNLSTLREMTAMALQYLRGRKLRTALTILSIVFGVMLIFSMNLFLPGAKDAFKQMVTTTSGTADLNITSATGESFDPTTPLKAAAAVSGVQAVSGTLRRQITVSSIGMVGDVGTAAQVEIVGINPDTIQSVRKIVISSGRFLQADDTGKVLLPASIADLSSDLQVGAVFPLITANGINQYTVVGFVANDTVTSTVQIIMPLKDAQAAMDQPGLINTIEVSVHADADKNAVAADLQKALGDNFRVNSTSSAVDALSSLEIASTMLSILGGFALFIGGFLIFNTFRTVVVERRHDLGMLRAIGAKRNQLTQLILIEGLIQGVIGTAIGLLVGYGIALLISAGFAKIAKNFFSGGFNLTISLNTQAVILATGLGLLTTLIAVYFPARSVAKLSPIEALRPSTLAESRRAAHWGLIVGIVVLVLSVIMLVASKETTTTGAIVFLIGIILISPSLVLPVARFFSPILSLWFAREGDVARGNLIRQPGRAAITASTLMVGLAMLVAMSALVASFYTFTINLVLRNFSSDILVLPPTIGVYGGTIGADESLNTKINALPEVQVASGLRYATGEVNGQTVQVLGIDPANYPKVAPLVFTEGTDPNIYSTLETGRMAIVNTTLAAALKLKVGDSISVQTADGQEQYQVAALSNDVLSLKVATIFISQANMKADFHKAEDIMLFINLKPGADKTAALADIQNLLKPYPQFTAKITSEYRATLVDLTAGALNGLYVLVLIIMFPAALGLLNTLTINVLERTREIGVIRAVGGSRVQVRRIVIAEALLLGLFGATLGILAGIALSYGFTLGFSAIGWTLPYSFPLLGLFAALICAVLLALVASLVPARSAAKLDIIRALQYE